jgi:hypothetical protein
MGNLRGPVFLNRGKDGGQGHPVVLLKGHHLLLLGGRLLAHPLLKKFKNLKGLCHEMKFL